MGGTLDIPGTLDIVPPAAEAGPATQIKLQNSTILDINCIEDLEILGRINDELKGVPRTSLGGGGVSNPEIILAGPHWVDGTGTPPTPNLVAPGVEWANFDQNTQWRCAVPWPVDKTTVDFALMVATFAGSPVGLTVKMASVTDDATDILDAANVFFSATVNVPAASGDNIHQLITFSSTPASSFLTKLQALGAMYLLVLNPTVDDVRYYMGKAKFS